MEQLKGNEHLPNPNFYTLQISELAQKLGIQTDEGGKPFWKGVNLPQAISEVIQLTYGKHKVIFDGGAPGFLVSAMAIASQAAETYLADPKRIAEGGMIQIKPIPLSDNEQGAGTSNVQWMVKAKSGLTEIEFSIKGEIDPTEMKLLQLPKLPSHAITIISGRGPNWLYASIARGYAQHVAAIACYQPGLPSKNKPGLMTFIWTDTEQIPLGTTIHEVQDYPQALFLSQTLDNPIIIIKEK